MKTMARIVLFTLVALALPQVALADDTIKHVGDHPDYSFEIEPHLVLGWGGYGAYSMAGKPGLGAGVRMGIPIVKDGFIKTINNSVAITFGADLAYWSGGCYRVANFNSICNSVTYLMLPVALQWNFYVHQRWSVFGEPGLFIYNGFYDDPCASLNGTGIACGSSSHLGAYPAFYAGGRYHFSEHTALTMRIGYPTFSLGVSFM